MIGRLALAALGLAACAQAPAQLLLYIDTDAPLPPPFGAPLDPDAPPALFDRLLIEVFRPGQSTPCPDCSHDFPLDSGQIIERRTSFGVPAPDVAGYRARLRLFPSLLRNGVEPRVDAAIEAWLDLPMSSVPGPIEYTVFLATDRVGKSGTSAGAPTLDPGPPPAERNRSWPGARRIPCPSAPGPEEACVPGGAFWMGNARVPHVAIMNGAEVEAERIVVVSPFFIDRHEVTSRRVRDWLAGNPREATGVVFWSGPADPLGPYYFCTIEPVANPSGTRDDLPANCIEQPVAGDYCESLGKELPSEAQFEYLDSGLAGHIYPWGDALPACADAVFDISGTGFATGMGGNSCRAIGAEGGVKPAGSGVRDRITLAGAEVVDLAGNVKEWVRDGYQPYGGACWPGGVQTDPVCPLADFESQMARGGGFTSTGVQLAAGVRTLLYTSNGGFRGAMDLGFRCARKAQ